MDNLNWRYSRINRVNHYKINIKSEKPLKILKTISGSCPWCFLSVQVKKGLDKSRWTVPLTINLDRRRWN
jgi:hypothetical protein